MVLRVCDATLDDAALIQRITLAAYAEYLHSLHPPSGVHRETVEDVAATMRRGGAVLAWLDGDPAGAARYERRDAYLYVGRVAVLPACRRRGVASAMMRHLEDLARWNSFAEIRLGVRASLPSNVDLYRTLGYDSIAVEPHPRGPDFIHTMVKAVRRA